jgi:hypothetical protein
MKKAKDERDQLIKEWLQTLVSSNIPIEKSDLLMPFLRKHCHNAGAIPNHQTLLSLHFPKLAADVKKLISTRFSGRRVCVEIDETPDARGRKVVNMVLHLDGIPHLVSVHYPDTVDSLVITQIVNQQLMTLGVQYKDLVGFIADGVSYNVKSFDQLHVMYPSCVRVWCFAHILHLVGESISGHEKMELLVTWMLNARKLFHNSSAAKTRWIQFLNGKGFVGTQMPSWSDTRWRTWFDAVEWMSERMDLFKEFLELEHVRRKSQSKCEWYQPLASIAIDPQKWAQMKHEYS